MMASQFHISIGIYSIFTRHFRVTVIVISGERVIKNVVAIIVISVDLECGEERKLRYTSID